MKDLAHSLFVIFTIAIIFAIFWALGEYVGFKNVVLSMQDCPEGETVTRLRETKAKHINLELPTEYHGLSCWSHYYVLPPSNWHSWNWTICMRPQDQQEIIVPKGPGFLAQIITSDGPTGEAQLSHACWPPTTEYLGLSPIRVRVSSPFRLIMKLNCQ